MSTIINISKARDSLGPLVDGAEFKGERITIERHGKPAATLVSIEDARFLEEIEDYIDLKEAKEALAKGNFVPLEDVLKELGID